MRLDEELLVTGGLRVYTWDGPWVSLGRFQSPERDLLPGCTVPYVMRPTGGRAVLHGHDLTVSIGLIDAELAGSRSVKRAYRRIIQPILDAFRAAGVDACLGEDVRAVSQNPRSTDCFAHVSANDVIERQTRRKICGCALRLTDVAVLAQCSIPLGPPLVNLASVFLAPATIDPVQMSTERFIAGLKVETDRP